MRLCRRLSPCNQLGLFKLRFWQWAILVGLRYVFGLLFLLDPRADFLVFIELAVRVLCLLELAARFYVSIVFM